MHTSTNAAEQQETSDQYHHRHPEMDVGQNRSDPVAMRFRGV